MSNTLKTLRQRVQDRTNRPIGGSDADVVAQINDAYMSVVRDIKTTYTSEVVDLVAGQGDYSLSADVADGGFELSILGIKYIEYGRNDFSRPIEQVSQDRIMRYRGTSAGTGAAYYYSLVGEDFLSIYPAPAVGDTMTIWYYAAPTALAVDADTVDASAVPLGWQDLIVHRACAESILHMNRGKPAGYISTIAMSEQFMQKYKQGLSDFRRERNLSRGSQGRIIEYGPPRWPRYSNDTDVRGRDRY